MSGNVDFGIRVSLEGGQQAVQQTDELARNFGALEGVAQRFGAALAAVVGTVATRAFVQMADSVTVLKNQLNLATGSIQQAEVAYGALFQIAQRSRQSFTELGGTFASISRATQELGISQGRLLRVTEAIGNAIAISGGSAAGAQAALTQLSQGFASGTLRGEELNSVMEQTPRLAKAIADGLGVTIGQLRTLGQEGKLTGEAVLGALEAQARVLSGEVQNSVATVAQASQVAQNALTALVGEIDRVTGASGGMAGAIIAASEALTDITQALRGVEGAGQSVSVVGSAFSVLFETITVLGANVWFVLQGIGRELGGLAAQAVAIATGQFAQAGAIRKALVADAEKARADIDALEQRVLRARQLRELAQQALEGVDTRAEDARLSRQGQQQRLVAQATKATAEELRAAAQEAKKQQQVLNELVGATDDFTESARRLQVMRQRGILTEQQYDQALSRLVQRQPAVIAAERQAAAAAQDRVEARRAEQRAIDEAIRSWEREREASLQSVRERVSQLEQEAEAVELSRSRNISLAQAIEEVAIARLREQQARYTEGSEPYLAIEKEIEARQRLLQLIGQKEAREASTKAAEDAARAWQSTADDIRGALTDAFRRAFESGESFGRAFGQVIEREIKARLASALAGLVTNGIIQIVGGALTGQSAGGGGSSSGAAMTWLQGANTASSLYGAASGYSGGVNALARMLGAGSTAGAAAGSLAYANAVGAMGGDSLGAFIAANNSWGGVAAGSSTAAGSSAAAGASLGAYAGYAAMIYAAAMHQSSLYDKGFTGLDQMSGKFLFDISVFALGAKLLKGLGMSDKWSNILSGAVAFNYLFGRAAPKITEQGITGVLSGGDFEGSAYANWKSKGGLFRSDKKGTILADLPDELARFLDDAAASVRNSVAQYGQALGLPADELDRITRQIKIALTDDAEANMQAIAKEMGSYGDALVDSWAAAVAPLANYGETTAQTIARVGSAIVGVNDVLEALGKAALQASIDGGQAALTLQQYFGSLENMQQAAGSYLQNYYSDEERRSLLLGRMGGALGDVGIGDVPQTREAFRSLVDSLDLTTDSGQRAFAALMGVADAFAAVVPAAEDASAALAQAAADIARERESLQVDLWREQGNDGALREWERSQVHAENLDLYDELLALRDSKAEAARMAEAERQRQAAAESARAAWAQAEAAAFEAASQAAQAWQAARTAIESEIRRLRGITDGPGTTNTAALAAQFATATAAARAGDATAAASLPEISRALSEAFTQQASSRQEVQLLNARLAASLERTNIATGGGPVAAPDAMLAYAEMIKRLGRIADVLEQFDVDGMPEVRT